MARHTAKSHKIRKVEILVIQITILIPIQEELRNKIKITGVETEKEGKEK